MTDNRLEQLKQKYISALRVLERLGIRLQKLRLQDDKLFLHAEAPSQEAKNKFWDQVKLVDPNYSDLIADVIVSPMGQQPTQELEDAPPQPQAPPQLGSYRAYTVKAGDTLSKIAQKVYGDANKHMKIFEANREQIVNPDKIQAGQELVIPED